MAIDFHAPRNADTYAKREAPEEWASTMIQIAEPEGARVADIGCGGGVYSRAWKALGAEAVEGVDFSQVMVATARKTSAGLDNICFRQGRAEETGLESGTFDIVFERALIHHLKDLMPAFHEAWRVLKPGGLFLIQHRTMEDVLQPASVEHLRGYFFKALPHLLQKEVSRRQDRDTVQSSLKAAGFEELACHALWETRKIYSCREALAEDLLNRTGRSLLHELDDTDLETLIAEVLSHAPQEGKIRERDRWTLFMARKPE
ncbi:class I SAM-dependent methyltransferase [Roseibium suaedae]|uniref:Ubiquinone/menaquinone biosynthesis C-methylase UbiE n=1 Tax=Roseibium suaedae TaxID=735517 RepID=A0A1M7FTE8_9HYPH|nr:class I SAM-dependent methyltransferase [Roseibium suaedae]SHM07220.1 Ubiquinone/menaquinone biosynthesis C-methylase UbiE [Roseibium suaedae]